THVGRLIDYTAMASAQGMIALMMCDGAWSRKWVSPTGGRERRLGVNPWSLTVPNATSGAVGFDMTSGSVSGWKILRAQEEGRPVPLGWLLDAAGNPTTDADAIDNGGSMMPMGGMEGSYKGYVLSFMIDVLANVLSGQEFREDPDRPSPIIDGCFMAV